MEWRHHDVHWPFVRFDISKLKSAPIQNTPDFKREWFSEIDNHDITNIANWFEHRANNGDGTYQMFGELVDACVFFITSQCGNGEESRPHVKCMEEIPAEYLATRFARLPRISLQFAYGKGFYGPKVYG